MSTVPANRTERAIEELLIRKNGRSKTANDVFEVLVAMHRDAREFYDFSLGVYDGLSARLDNHISDRSHINGDELLAFTEEIRNNLQRMREECEERRENCPALRDEEIGDIKRGWRVVKWAVAIGCAPIIVALGNRLADYMW